MSAYAALIAFSAILQLNHHNKTKHHHQKTPSPGNRGKSKRKKKTVFTYCAPNDLPNNLLKYRTRAFNHPVYYIRNRNRRPRVKNTLFLPKFRLLSCASFLYYQHSHVKCAVFPRPTIVKIYLLGPNYNEVVMWKYIKL
jgi:hypothetical protein